MKMLTIAAVALIAILGLQSSAKASFHSAPAREATRLHLLAATEASCSQMTEKDCQSLTTLAQSVFADPKQATAADLAALTNIRVIFSRYQTVPTFIDTSRVGLASALDGAEMLGNHVLFMHAGIWEGVNFCSSPS